MRNRANQARSFNTVKHSNREERIERARRARLALLTMICIGIIMALTATVFLIASTVEHFQSTRPQKPDPDGTTDPLEGNGTPPAVEYETRTEDSVEGIKSGILTVVNDDCYFNPALAENLVNIQAQLPLYEDTYRMYSVQDSGWKLNKTALSKFNELMLAHYEISEGDGSVAITSAWRSLQDQENFSSEPGHSDHHTGYCLALRDANGQVVSGHWIADNAHKYGFIMRYPSEKSSITGVSGYEYCYRYVGVAHATYIQENGLCLEEYVDLLRANYADDTHLRIKGADGNSYEVYYVPAGSDQLTSIRVPSGYEVDISGDNIGGFIVTVNWDKPLADE